MALKIFNTLSGEKEEFVPLKTGEVKMYVCGVTVYDSSHLGHCRFLLSFDVIYRYLRFCGYQVHYVRNFTDVDDKIIKRAQEDNVSCEVITEKYIEEFHRDASALGLLEPTQEPRATDHIAEIVKLIQRLEEKGLAYRVDGDVFYPVQGFAGYGKLSRKKIDELEAGARVEVDERKRSPLDFALWKSSKAGEPTWESPWGPGRPGWHIECSAMSTKYLGQPFDIHGGGRDLIFPHHENEIAQSESLTGKPFVHFWFHARFLLVEGEKMSKSLGNFFTLRDLVLKGHKPSSIRFLLASVPYRNQLNFTFDGLKQAAVSVERLRNFQSRLEVGQFPQGTTEPMAELARDTLQRFRAGMEDDLNTAQAQAAIFDMVRKANAAIDAGQLKKDDAAVLLDVLEKFDQIFAVLIDDETEKMKKILEWARSENREKDVSNALLKTVDAQQLSDAAIEQKIAEMEQARRSRKFQSSDAIRAELTAAGIVVENTKDGVRWKRK